MRQLRISTAISLLLLSVVFVFDPHWVSDPSLRDFLSVLRFGGIVAFSMLVLVGVGTLLLTRYAKALEEHDES